MTTATATAKELFPASLAQGIAFSVVSDGERVELMHTLNGATDAQIFNYYDTDDGEGVSASAVALWDELISGAAGYELDESAESAPQRQQLIEGVVAADKAFVIEECLLYGLVLEAPTSKRKIKLGAQSATATHRLEALFNGRKFLTTHKLGALDTPTLQLVRKLYARQFPFAFGDAQITSFARGLVALYDALKVSVEGYAGEVPVHHKLKVAAAHLSSQQRMIAGK